MVSSPASGRLAIRDVQVGQDQFTRTTKVRYSHSVHAPGCTIPLRTVIRDQKKLGAQEDPPSITDLNTSLTDMNRDNFTHCL